MAQMTVYMKGFTGSTTFIFTVCSTAPSGKKSINPGLKISLKGC